MFARRKMYNMGGEKLSLNLYYKMLLTQNVYLNGLKAIIYCFGLSSSRYVEYASVLNFLSQVTLKKDSKILDIGCGHSILPSLLDMQELCISVIDIITTSLKWQKLNRITSCVQASGVKLPFKSNSFDVVISVSAIEHIPDDGDIFTAREIGRVLKPNGICLLSVPLSTIGKSFIETDWTCGIPSSHTRLFRSVLPTIFKKFNVDRNHSFFERRYHMTDVYSRIVEPSGCILEDYITFARRSIANFIYKFSPLGLLTFLEYLMAKKGLVLGDMVENSSAIILRLKKLKTE